MERLVDQSSPADQPVDQSSLVAARVERLVAPSQVEALEARAPVAQQAEQSLAALQVEASFPPSMVA